MFKFRTDFNCCKTVNCENFGVIKSDDYIPQSRRLGYLSIECKLCGSNCPWINNELVNGIVKEKLEFQFARKLTHCPKCHQYFFFSERTDAKLHGFTSAGTQRKKCCVCHTIYTVQNYKNIEALKSVLASIIANKEIRESIKASGLSARLYYFYLDKLSSIFSNFSRLHEEEVMERSYLAMHTEGRVIKLDHKRGMYSLITSEVDSGYILLNSNNLTRQSVVDYYIYDESENTIITSNYSDNLENVLTNRYQQNMNRNHFEQLLVGELKPVTKCNLIYPDKLAYIHFQLLNAFSRKADKYDHYIEHESTLRSGALMASYEDIKKSNADVYFFVPFLNSREKLQGKKIGWWKDRWFSNELGAICPITCKLTDSADIKLHHSDSIDLFFTYIDRHMNKGVNSINVIDQLSEIHRVIFNYCDLKNNTTRAITFGVAQKSYTPESLLEDALKMIMS
ncbi:hypothetical protein [Psychromonas ossibalaenae]|uniref:hypothetical protein n=1 Tax=Psychromonas ossibalaenae TaxID=444922 RepID=UPI00037260DA|nr:hypothetical protein [Psychromonas ossibalaenae]